MAPRIAEALRRHAFEKGVDLTWAEFGRLVWEEALGEAEGVTKSKLSLIKNGHQEPTAREAAAIAFVLDCSPQWLVWSYDEIGRFPSQEFPDRFMKKFDREREEAAEREREERLTAKRGTSKKVDPDRGNPEDRKQKPRRA